MNHNRLLTIAAFWMILTSLLVLAFVVADVAGGAEPLAPEPLDYMTVQYRLVYSDLYLVVNGQQYALDEFGALCWRVEALVANPDWAGTQGYAVISRPLEAGAPCDGAVPSAGASRDER